MRVCICVQMIEWGVCAPVPLCVCVLVRKLVKKWKSIVLVCFTVDIM